MGFGVNTYAKIWEVEDKGGKYAMCKITISTKRPSGNYETTFRGTVAFFNEAYHCRPQVGQRIKIKNCDVTNREYVKPDGTKTYPVQFSIFSYELQEDKNAGESTNTGASNNKAKPQLFEVADDGDIPF